jgi:hypothetical protein
MGVDHHNDFMSEGFFRQGPPSREAAVKQRTHRRGVQCKYDKRYTAATPHGATQCGPCWARGSSAVKCRVTGHDCLSHGPAAPDFDSTLFGKYVVCAAKANNTGGLEGLVTAFDSASGEHVVTTAAGEKVEVYLGYVPAVRMTVSGVRCGARVVSHNAQALTRAPRSVQTLCRRRSRVWLRLLRRLRRLRRRSCRRTRRTPLMLVRTRAAHTRACLDFPSSFAYVPLWHTRSGRRGAGRRGGGGKGLDHRWSKPS